MSGTVERPISIKHSGEESSNQLRHELSQVEPLCLRTRTPSMAIFGRSAGSYHWTPEGRKLADFTSGVLVSNLGHNPRRWWNRVLKLMALDNLNTGNDEYVSAVTLTAYNGATEVEIEASRRLINNLQSQPGGEGCQQVLWSASGSEAVQKALWASMARRPGEDIILATRFGFHGKKGLAGAVTGSENDRERDPRVRFISFPMEECRNLEARKQPLDLAKYEAELEALWNEFGSRICCLITEPYLGGGGSFHPQKEYTQLLEKFCKQHDIIFIFDEIQANFGRTGQMYAFTHYGVTPDIVCLGKGLGNGIPVAAAVGRADIFGALNYGEGSDTWSANPLSAAAVVATLDEFENTDVLAHAKKLSEILEAGLIKLGTLPAIANIRGEGMVWGIECAELGGRSAAEVASAVVEAAYLGDEQGRAVHLLGPLSGKVIRVSPPLTMDLDEAAEYMEVLYNVTQKLS